MPPTEATEVILARGHENILATHKTTFEITKESSLSKRGNCVLAVAADKAMDDLSPEFKEKLRKDGAKVTVSIEAGEISETINAYGNPHLVLTHPTDIVIRKSSYICDRTLAIKADKAACDLSRTLVKKLRSPGQRVKIALTLRAH